MWRSAGAPFTTATSIGHPIAYRAGGTPRGDCLAGEIKGYGVALEANLRGGIGPG